MGYFFLAIMIITIKERQDAGPYIIEICTESQRIVFFLFATRSSTNTD